MKNILFSLSFLLITGCGTVQHNVKFENFYTPSTNTKISIGSTKNDTGEPFDIDIGKMLNDALIQELQNADLYVKSAENENLTLHTSIINYKKGDAFKRWLLPGWGSTELTIESKLINSRNESVGSVKAIRTVDAGGGYTIGAWKSVFTNIAKDIVTDLSAQIKSQ